MRVRTTPVGNQRDATRAVKGELMFVGSGLYRAVYVDKRYRTVYKVDDYDGTNGEEPSYSANMDEYENILNYRRELGRFIPPASLWDVEHEGVKYTVLAMPYFPLHSDDVSEDKRERAYNFLYKRLPPSLQWDLHDENFRFTKGGHVRMTDIQQQG